MGTDVKSDLLRPDGFAIGLFVVGVVLLVVPLMLMVGILAIGLAFIYWLIMIVAKLVYRRRA